MSTVSRILLTFVFGLMFAACVQDASAPKSNPPNDNQPPTNSPAPTVTLSAQPTTLSLVYPRNGS